MDKNNYIFWLDDPTILYKNNAYTKFIPSADMTRIEQLNAVSRFCLYAIILMVIFGYRNSWLYVPIIGLIFTVVLYNIYLYDPEGTKKELFNERTNKYADILDDNTLVSPDSDEYYDIESGYYDSGNHLHIGKDYNTVVQKKPLYYSPEELISYTQHTCKRPSIDNPMANTPITMLNTPNSVAACNADDEDIKDEVNNLLDQDLYKDVGDLFTIKNSQRQFYTMPSTAIPSNREDFQNWLYNIGETCKESSAQCLRWEDLRFKR